MGIRDRIKHKVLIANVALAERVMEFSERRDLASTPEVWKWLQEAYTLLCDFEERHCVPLLDELERMRSMKRTGRRR